MLRKLCLVGLVVLIHQGSYEQLIVAVVLSFIFFGLHVYSQPYKLRADNMLKLAIEIQIFATITIGVFVKAQATAPGPDTDANAAYDACLVVLFLINIPCGLILSVLHKVRHVRALVARRDSLTDDPRAALRHAYALF
eukprot:SAG11_NODE_20351_length_447_cov_1.040230_1_plen_137_part_01